jgi:hypothetical protein
VEEEAEEEEEEEDGEEDAARVGVFDVGVCRRRAGRARL